MIKSKKESRYFGWNHDVIWSNNPDFTVNKTFSEDEKCKECIISSFPKRPGPIQGREKREGRCNIHPNLLIPVQCGKILVSLAYEITWPCKDTFSSKVLADSVGAMRQSEFVPVTITKTRFLINHLLNDLLKRISAIKSTGQLTSWIYIQPWKRLIFKH